jgi:hypothetical protein
MRPRPGDRDLVFVRQGVKYFPQAPISYDIQTQSWSCKPVWIEAKEDRWKRRTLPQRPLKLPAALLGAAHWRNYEFA